MAKRTLVLNIAAVIGLTSLGKGEEASIRESADNVNKERSLQYDESWYNIPEPMVDDRQTYYTPLTGVPVDNGGAWWNGGEVIPEAKAGKEEYSNNGGTPGGWQGGSGKSSKANEASGWWQATEAPGWGQPGSGGKSEKAASGWWQATEAPGWVQPGSGGKSEKAASGWWQTTEAPGWWQPGSGGKSEKAASGWWQTTEAPGWWQPGTGKSQKTHPTKASKSKSAKHSSIGGSMPKIFTAKSLKAAKAKATKSAKHAGTVWVSGSPPSGGVSTWNPPTPCGKAEDCGQSGDHPVPAGTPPPGPSMSPVAPLVPVTMAPIGNSLPPAYPTYSPTTTMDGLTRENGWFQSGNNFETEELAYKRERVEGLAKGMEWKNSSSKLPVCSYLAVGAAAAAFYFMLC